MKNKNKSLDFGKWKEFRYNLMTENTIPENETDSHTYQLKNGKTLVVDEETGPGMAQEPMVFVTLQVDGKTVRFSDIENLMDPKEAEELKTYLDDVSDSNDASAKNWVM